jgi:hypothetical protein
VNGHSPIAQLCARLVIVALAGGIVMELTHAIEGTDPGLLRPNDWICRASTSRAASANDD